MCIVRSSCLIVCFLRERYANPLVSLLPRSVRHALLERAWLSLVCILSCFFKESVPYALVAFRFKALAFDCFDNVLADSKVLSALKIRRSLHIIEFTVLSFLSDVDMDQTMRRPVVGPSHMFSVTKPLTNASIFF